MRWESLKRTAHFKWNFLHYLLTLVSLHLVFFFSVEFKKWIILKNILVLASALALFGMFTRVRERRLTCEWIIILSWIFSMNHLICFTKLFWMILILELKWNIRSSPSISACLSDSIALPGLQYTIHTDHFYDAFTMFLNNSKEPNRLRPFKLSEFWGKNEDMRVSKLWQKKGELTP